MDYTKESLERVSFQTRGKWYLAEQVDAFLDELSDSVERDAQTASQWRRERDDLRKEKERLQQERDALRQENARLKKEREEARAGEQAALTQLQAAQEKLAASPGEERRRRVCQDLEQERAAQLPGDLPEGGGGGRPRPAAAGGAPAFGKAAVAGKHRTLMGKEPGSGGNQNGPFGAPPGAAGGRGGPLPDTQYGVRDEIQRDERRAS